LSAKRRCKERSSFCVSCPGSGVSVFLDFYRRPGEQMDGWNYTERAPKACAKLGICLMLINYGTISGLCAQIGWERREKKKTCSPQHLASDLSASGPPPHRMPNRNSSQCNRAQDRVFPSCACIYAYPRYASPPPSTMAAYRPTPIAVLLRWRPCIRGAAALMALGFGSPSFFHSVSYVCV
jgi:hypothetical protein